MSFLSVFSAMAQALTEDPLFQSFCLSRWGKSCKVVRGYRQRREIAMSELPIILMTRPAVDPDPVYGLQEPQHTVRLYVGFYQPDAAQGADDMILFEEAVKEAVARLDPGAPCDGITVQQSRNDEGALAPSYFAVIDLSVKTSG